MAFYAPLPTMAPPETAGGIVDLGEHGVLLGAETLNFVTTGLPAYVPLEDVPEEKQAETYG